MTPNRRPWTLIDSALLRISAAMSGVICGTLLVLLLLSVHLTPATAADWAAEHTALVTASAQSGSAVAWDEDTFLTAGHVVGDSFAQEITVTLQGVTWYVTEVRPIPGVDAAWLDVAGPSLTDLPSFRSSRPITGEIVFCTGFARGQHRLATQGYMLDYQYVDAALIPGMSGGPAIDASGRVIGLNVRVTGGMGRSIGIILPIADILNHNGRL